MGRIRTLIVDDSALVRRFLANVLTVSPDIELVGQAQNGREALALLSAARPDIVVLDVEMPQMGGIETLIELKKRHPALPVIMFSSLTERGAAVTLDAFAHGASDYVTKPQNTGSAADSAAVIRDELVPRICAIVRRVPSARLRARKGPAEAAVLPPPRSMGPGPVKVVAIGSSTGGPNALSAVMEGLPEGFGVPVVITQHMPPLFTRFLAERLTQGTHLEVHEAKDGQLLLSGHAYVAPGGYHLEVVRDGGEVVARTTQEPPVHHCRPAVDVLFGSVARTYGRHALAVVLTGMGQDGLEGSRSIYEEGGVVLAQDEASSTVWSMPGAVVRAGLAERVLPPPELGAEIRRRVSK